MDSGGFELNGRRSTYMGSSISGRVGKGEATIQRGLGRIRESIHAEVHASGLARSSTRGPEKHQTRQTNGGGVYVKIRPVHHANWLVGCYPLNTLLRWS